MSRKRLITTPKSNDYGTNSNDEYEMKCILLDSPSQIKFPQRDESKHSLSDFFTEIELPNYTELFREKLGIKTCDQLMDCKDLITCDELRKIGIYKLPDQMAILEELKDLQFRDENYKTPNTKPKEYKAKKAWLSADTTIEEINVINQYFRIEGDISIFWEDTRFDKNKQLNRFKSNTKYSTKCIHRLLDRYHHDYVIDLDESTLIKTDNINYFTLQETNDQKYIKMTSFLETFSEKYQMPFQYSQKDGTINMFNNALDFELTGTNSIELHYNTDHQTFKLQIHFKSTLYEYFENNFSDFPFEWQFLNAQILYNVNHYQFVEKIPDFVEKSFCDNAYWEHAEKIWKYSVRARKRDNIQEWILLKPWVDLRDKSHRKEEFDFGLIKYRVKRNPHYYLLNIVLPLFFMGNCGFAIFVIDDITDKLSYLITLLLTVTAFQLSVSSDLPYKSQFTLIDTYFLLEYFILALLVLDSVLPGHIIFDYVSLIILPVLWNVYSSGFLWKYMYFKRPHKCKSNEVIQTICCCVCCIHWSSCRCKKSARKRQEFKYWMKIEKNESLEWDTSGIEAGKTKIAELVFGSNGDGYTEELKIKEWRDDIIKEL